MKELQFDSLENLNGGGWISDTATVVAGACAGYGLGGMLARTLLQVTVPPLGTALTVGCFVAAGVAASGV